MSLCILFVDLFVKHGTCDQLLFGKSNRATLSPNRNRRAHLSLPRLYSHTHKEPLSQAADFLDLVLVRCNE